MALFMIIIIISSQAFNKILSISSQQTKSSESNVQGIIGLEMMRVDLEHAGYGLPWKLDFVANFPEGDAAANYIAPGIATEGFNDTNNTTSDTNKVPRAVLAAKSTSSVPVERDRDYLVIKSVLAGTSDTVRKWTYVQGVGTDSRLKAWGTNDFKAGERVITIDSRTKKLIGTGTAAASFSYPITAQMLPPPATPLATPLDPPTAAFQPQQDTDVFVAYAVSESTDLRAPYNRVDYFVKRPTTAGSMPTRCAEGTGILYKAVMNQSNGAFPPSPLIECVADMQVIFTLDTDGDGAADLHVGEDGLSALTAKEIRSQLKEIRVYIVAHEGGKDSNYTHSASSIYVGEFGNGRTLDLTLFGADYKNYRWKMYKLVVAPKNINN